MNENRAMSTERSDKSVSFDALNEKTDDIIWSTSKMCARFRLNRRLDEFFHRAPFRRIRQSLLSHQSSLKYIAIKIGDKKKV